MEFARNGKLARLLAVLLSTGALVYSATRAHAQDANRMPFDTPTEIGGVQTVCTGVSLDAREDPRWNAYPLKVELAGKGGQYLGDVQISVTKDGKSVLETACGGPWVLFKLPPARYQVAATIEGKTVSSAAYVPASGQGRIILRFPELGGALEKPAENNAHEGGANLANSD